MTEYSPDVLYPNAILLPVLAFPAWILCIPPFVWHASQRNVAAASLILWIMLINFCNSINPLLWSHDNITEWWDGNVLCDIEVRLFIGSGVGLASCVAMIMRKLATVMDTRNITIAPSRAQVLREKMLDYLWCWAFPALMMLVYYIVQWCRYFLFGISGCVVVYDSSWPSVVLGPMPGTIAICFAAYYAGVLGYRLHHYRREFHRLISARNTTKSRFVRLFIMSILVIAVLLPYNFWILWVHGTNVTEEYSWSRVHGGNWNQVIKLPSNGEVRLDRWGQVTAGYLAFILFGTGADANNTYKRMLCAIGLGKIFPSLYKESRSGTSTPSNVTFAKVWSSTASKARSIFSKRDSVVEGSLAGTRHNSVSVGAALSSSLHSESTACHNTSTATSIPSHQPPKPHFINRLFARRDHLPMLPLFANTIVTEMADLDKSVANKSPTSTTSSGGYSHRAHAWSSDIPTTFGNRNSDRDVRVVQEVHQVVHHGKTDKVDRPGTSA